jgi:SAM-dependent methyltransferase
VYRPLVGQAGKDVMWVPTLDSAVMPMLEAARVTADDLVYDLGSGDGKIPIWAARQFGARAVGIEYDEKLSALAVRNAERAGVTDRVKMIHGDIFKEDFSQATVLTLYLGRDLNLRLKPTIMKMRPGTRVVSNAFDLGVWEPDRVINLPVPRPTSCAFGGPDFTTLYVTSARIRLSVQQLAEAPLSGSVFAIQTGVKGLPEVPFAG